jgi:hypothetical protein
MLKRMLPFLPILLLLVFAACTPEPGIPNTGTGGNPSATPSIDPLVKTAVIQSVTAAAWTATFTPTPALDTQEFVKAVNSAMVGVDPLSETIEAKFEVIDVEYLIDDQSKEIRTMRIHVECEWIFSDNCTPEESFVHLMQAFAADKMIDKVSTLVPATLKDVQVVTFNHMKQNGIIMIGWRDVVAYGTKKINGQQLGSRIVRLTP